MPGPLIVSIPHSLGREEAMRRIKTGLARATSQLPILQLDEERWEDSRMDFRVRALGQAVQRSPPSDGEQPRPGTIGQLPRRPGSQRLADGVLEGVLGQVDVADDHVKVEITLPFLLQRFAEMAQAAIRERGRLLLTKK